MTAFRYRTRTRAEGLVSFRLSIKQTDLWVSAERSLEKETRDLLLEARTCVETYISLHPEFATSLAPFSSDPFAPPLVREMIEETSKAQVGPMASVAGAIAQFVGRGLLQKTDQVIVENGGDIFLKANRPITVGIYAGPSPLSERLGLVIPVRQMPLGVCCSSGSLGHSLSMGRADAVSIVSSSATLADGAATALGNRIHGVKDLEKVADWAAQIPGLVGGLVILQDAMVSWGDIELTSI